MARTFTLGTLVTRAKERADLENSPHIDDSEWKGYLSTAYAQLYSILVSSGLRYFESVQSISSASLTSNGDGGAFIALPSDYYSTLAVDYVPNGSNQQRMELYQMMFGERNMYSSVTGASQAEAFSLSGVNLVLYPSPPTGQTYKHIYVAQPADLSAGADGTTVDVVTPDGEDYLIWTAAMFALTKEESDTAVCERYRAMAEERLEKEATKRLLIERQRQVISDALYTFDPGDWRVRRW